LPRHDVILAEGAPAESYLDTGNRNMFGNVLTYLALGLPVGTTRAAPCRPVVTDGPALAAVRVSLADHRPAGRATEAPAAMRLSA
jgi:hypothetical protein